MNFIQGICFLSVIVSGVAFKDDEPSFNRELFEVRFHPYEFLTNATLSMVVSDLIQPLDKIATQFTRLNILMGKRLVKAVHVTLVPSAVAIYNRDYLKPNTLPLELSITIFTGQMFDSPENLTLLINRYINIADTANQIYPGTVGTILFELNTFRSFEKNVEDQTFEKYLSNARIPSHTKIKLGVSLALKYCEYDSYLLQVVKKVRHIGLNYYESDKFLNGTTQDPHAAVEILWKKLVECQQKIQTYGSDISIGIESRWEAKTNDTNGDKMLVEYWHAMNDLAVKHNVSVVLLEAFDEISNFTSQPWKNSGWWRVVKDNSSDQYIFEEKRKSLNSTSPTEPNPSGFPWVSVLIILICLVILILGILYARKRYPNFFYIQYARYMPSFGCCKM